MAVGRIKRKRGKRKEQQERIVLKSVKFKEEGTTLLSE
jgi:hypothetical protein